MVHTQRRNVHEPSRTKDAPSGGPLFMIAFSGDHTCSRTGMPGQLVALVQEKGNADVLVCSELLLVSDGWWFSRKEPQNKHVHNRKNILVTVELLTTSSCFQCFCMAADINAPTPGTGDDTVLVSCPPPPPVGATTPKWGQP